MRITIISLGTRGDVQPYLALGMGLQAAGHTVRIATQESFETFVRSRGLDFYPVQGNARNIADQNKQMSRAAAHAPALYLAHLMRVVGRLMRIQISDCLDACGDAEAIMFSMPSFFQASAVAEKLRVPLFPSDLVPISPTRAFAAPVIPFRPRLGERYNLLTYSIWRQIGWQLFRRAVNQARAEVLSLPALPFLGPAGTMQRQRLPFLYGFSPHVLPKPPDWGEWLHITGYWFLERPAGWQPPAQLLDFLSSGPPPIYVGFGSMSANHGRGGSLAELVVRALTRTGLRGVLEMGREGPRQKDLPDSILSLEELPVQTPHDWLLPRTAAVVHHGGAGTTAAGLRAGIPTLVVPFYSDQPFWGGQVAALGVGPRPIRQGQLSEENLSAALLRMTRDGLMRERATALGARIRGEDGVARAVDAFHSAARTRWGISLN